MNIAGILRERAAERGDAAALIDVRHGRDRIVSFRELDSASARFAHLITRRGVAAGDFVFILHQMSAELYAFLIALFRIGAVAMFVDLSAGPAFIERCLRSHPPKAFFGSFKAHLLRFRISALRHVELTICSAPLPGSLHLSLGARGSELETIAAVDQTTPALITFTSGSTGLPKGALRTHGFLLAQHRALESSLHHIAGTVDLTTLPVFVLSNLASGVTSVLPDADMRRPGNITARPVLRQIERLSITTMAASPAFVSRLTAECRRAMRRIEGMRRVFVGGAPVFPEDMRQARDASPNAEIVAVYGSTEAEPMAEIALSAITPDDFDAMAQGRGLLAGRPVPSILLRTVRDQWGSPIAALNEEQFRALCVDAGTVGEIVVSGQHVLQGYLDGSGDAETKFRVQGAIWHRTGDLGCLDEQGRLWLMGRASAAVKNDRGAIYPFAVECAARQIPGVRRAAILAIDGRCIMAIEADSEKAVDDVCVKMAWAGLDEIRVLHAIPMDRRHNAKIDYVALWRMLSKPK